MNKLKAFRLPQKLVLRLAKLAKKTHRTETFYVSDALENYLDEYEDALLATERYEDADTTYLTSKELRARLGL
jgi:predicted DNA-binding protein